MKGSVYQPDGVEKLVDKIEAAIPYGDTEDDARELFHLGAKINGMLSR